MPELEPTVGRYVAEGVIPGVARPGDTIIVDPDRRGIIVTHYVSWSKYPNLMAYQGRLRSLDQRPEVHAQQHPDGGPTGP